MGSPKAMMKLKDLSRVVYVILLLFSIHRVKIDRSRLYFQGHVHPSLQKVLEI